MNDVTFGRQLVATHLGQMNAESRKRWPKIRERKGFEIIEDRAYQGFDNDPACQHHRFCGHIPEMYTEPRFWCRSIRVRRISDGAVGWGIGPQADAYAQAVRKIEASE
jgi:hypothetical protein